MEVTNFAQEQARMQTRAGQKKLGDIEGIMWALLCICTFGGVWFTKVLIKKAIIDVENMKNA